MTDITFPCPKCGRHMSIDDSAVGMTVSCPHCAEQVGVPSPPPKKSTPVSGILSLTIPCAGLALFFSVNAFLREAEDFGVFIFVCLVAFLTVLAGPVLAVISLRRDEKPAAWACVGFLVFILPVLAGIFVLFRIFVIGR